MVVGEGVDGERDALTFLYTTDVGFVNVGNDAHVCQVLGNGEQLRGVERGCHRLAFLYALRQHHTVYGAGDGGIAQIGLCLLHTLARGVHLLAGFVVRQTGTLKVVGRNQSLVVERLIPVVVGLFVVQRALCAGQVSFGGVQLADEVGLVQLSNNLPLLDH